VYKKDFSGMSAPPVAWRPLFHKSSAACISGRVSPVDAGDASGQGLIAGTMIGQGLLTRQAKSNIVPPVRRVSWIDPIDDGRMVHDSIAQWNGTRLRAGLRRQQPQGHRQAVVLQPSTQGRHHGPKGCNC